MIFVYNNVTSINDCNNDLGSIRSLAGKHNAENIAAAVAACSVVGCKEIEIVEAVKSFAGLAHRMQYVGEAGKVSFINDSKATNAEAASKALSSYDNIYWIAGGVAKDGGIKSLEKYFTRIKHAYLIGQCQEEFSYDLNGKVEYSICNNLRSAFHNAFRDSINDNNKSVILLSPAAASFDQFANFEKRGEYFCQMYNDIVEA